MRKVAVVALLTMAVTASIATDANANWLKKALAESRKAAKAQQAEPPQKRIKKPKRQ